MDSTWMGNGDPIMYHPDNTKPIWRPIHMSDFTKASMEASYNLETTIVRFSVSSKLAKQIKSFPKVDIDASGTFKYILVQTYDENSQPRSIVVRGYGRHEWHNNIFDEVKEQFKPLKCEPLGGGKISHKPEEKKINIYGTSTGYGQADHELAAKMIRDAYPDYTVAVGEEPKEGREGK